MARINSYRELEVWQQAMVLAERCFRVTQAFPREEVFGLTAQVRKSAVSIPSNVAEGHNRRSREAYRHHVAIALGSHAELETQLELATRVGFMKKSDSFNDLSASVGRLLHGLVRALEQRPSAR